MTILIVGGAGYIGSHTCVELLDAGYDIVLYDNFCNSDLSILESIKNITDKRLSYVCGDIRDSALLESTLTKYNCDAVMHFAGLKSISQSVESPLAYYDNNVVGTLNLLNVMKKISIKKLVFSSSASVYGQPQFLPVTENHPLSVTNPYAHTKLVVEEILRNLYQAESSNWHIGILRYFNPVGAHPSGFMGENPKQEPTNLMPIITKVVGGQQKALKIWGTDYKTHDGTGVRDYIHVVDLAIGHLKALEQLDKPQCFTVNLGTGLGYSVLDLVNAFEKVSGVKIPVEMASRRVGDVAACFADSSKSFDFLGWKAERDIETMCADQWNFWLNNQKH